MDPGQNVKSIELKPIGHLSSCFKERFGTPRQGLLTPNSRAFLAVGPEWASALEGLEQFSHVWLISWFHLSEPISKNKIKPPRQNGEKLGIFSTRSPHRPNPIGLTLSEIDKVEPHGIWLRGVDLIEGTPILDIKPYVPRYDHIDATAPEWIEKPADLNFEMTSRFEQELQNLSLPAAVSVEEFVALVKEILIQDPRPLAYKGRSREDYYLTLYDFEVVCQFEDDLFKLLSVSAKEPDKKSKSSSIQTDQSKVL